MARCTYSRSRGAGLPFARDQQQPFVALADQHPRLGLDLGDVELVTARSARLLVRKAQ